MLRWLKRVGAILLLPSCAGLFHALLRVVSASGDSSSFWIVFLAGAACWWVIYLLLPKPMWFYVFGHELTHVLWTWLFWGKVRRFKASAKGGHVIITKTNFLIALSPYFFPIYAVAVVLVFGLGHALWNWSRYQVWFHLLLGAAYAFHVTLTWFILQTRQLDITDHGYLFSAVIIWIGNILVLVFGIPLLTGTVSVTEAAVWGWNETARIWQMLGNF